MKILGFISTLFLGSILAIGIYFIELKFEDSHLFLVSGIVLIFSILIMQQAVKVFNLHQLTIPGSWYLTYLMMVYFPSFFVFLEQDNPAKYRYIFAVESVLITVPLGMLYVNILSKFQKVEIKEYFQSPVIDEKLGPDLTITYLMFLTGAIVLTIMYVRETETIPLFYMIKNPGEYYYLAELREESFKLLNSPFTYIYHVLRILIYPFLVMVSLGYYLQKHQKVWLFLFLTTLVLGVLYAGFSIAKAPVAYIVLSVTLFLYLYKGGMINKKFIALSLILILAFPVLVILLLQSGMGVGIFDALKGIGNRIFYGPALSVYYYFEYFPDVHEYLYGRSIGKLSWLMGWEYFNTPNIVGMYAFPKGLKTINMNSAFIGDLNADFGMLGVLLGGFVTGLIMQGIQIYLLRQKKTLLNIAVYAFLISAFWLLNSTSLPVVLLSNGVIFVLILSWIIKAIHRILKVSTMRI